ncbi:MAG: DUF362 domain-containing protein [Smithellaceae bacterium]|nr:DUF362 domain-containing protein [Smithellaceae bacterium]
MEKIITRKVSGSQEDYAGHLRTLLGDMKAPFRKGDKVGIKLHWGERGNHSYLPALYAREIVTWLKSKEMKPFIFDTTVLYSGSRRRAEDALQTAAEHGYSGSYLGCPVIVGDGEEGRDVIDIPAGFKHFKDVQVASLVDNTDGFVIFSHFKGHLAAGFGGAIKNISMGFASRAQKQRMHAAVRPILKSAHCTGCGTCVLLCPSGAAQMGDDGMPVYDLEKCIGCAQCIAQCPELALKIIWGEDVNAFQEKVTETAAAVWKKICSRTIFVNALLNVSKDCDCLPGKMEVIAENWGFVGGYDPVSVDMESLNLIGADTFEKAHPHVRWRRQFEYADEIGFSSR